MIQDFVVHWLTSWTSVPEVAELIPTFWTYVQYCCHHQPALVHKGVVEINVNLTQTSLEISIVIIPQQEC